MGEVMSFPPDSGEGRPLTVELLGSGTEEVAAVAAEEAVVLGVAVGVAELKERRRRKDQRPVNCGVESFPGPSSNSIASPGAE